MRRRFTAALATLLLIGHAAAAPLTAAQEAQALDFAMHDAVFTLYHEAAHLLIGELGLPVLGKEEDAADAFATLVVLRGDAATRNAIIADEADGWYFSAAETTGNGLDDLSYFDEHSFDIERSYAIACLGIGADPKAYAEIARGYGFDDDQQSDCADIWEQTARSWDTVLKPHLATTPGPTIPVVYDRPGHFDTFATELRKRRVLETTAAYLSSHYALPGRVSIHAEICDEPDAWYDPDEHEIVYCYDLAEDVYQRAITHLFPADDAGNDHGKNVQKDHFAN